MKVLDAAVWVKCEVIDTDVSALSETAAKRQRMEEDFRNHPVQRAVSRKRVPTDGRLLAALAAAAKAKGAPLTQDEENIVRAKFEKEK